MRAHPKEGSQANLTAEIFGMPTQLRPPASISFFAGYAAAHLGQRRHSIADLAAGKKTLDSLPESLVSASSVMGALRGMCAIWTTTGSL